MPVLVLLVALLTAGASAKADDDAEKRAQAKALVTAFWERVWSPPCDLEAVEDLVVEDFVLTSAGSQTQKGPKLGQNWVERSAWELYRQINATQASSR